MSHEPRDFQRVATRTIHAGRILTLTDETYESLRDPTQSVYADPREVRLTLAYAYGSEQRHRGR